MDTYYAHYKSSVSAQTGCLKEFVSQSANNLGFPPQVTYSCDLCKSSHGFRLTNTNIINTPSQEKSFKAFCLKNQIERDVEVPVK